MTIRLWGTRGSLATPGAATARYGGNTSCVEVRGPHGTVLVLDAGTGIRPLGATLGDQVSRVDVLLSHLHMDHIQGLGFFGPLYDASVETHLWGPAASEAELRTRLCRYLSPPLFPVHLRDLPRLVLHAVPGGVFRVGEFQVAAERICHPGFTIGYRIAENGGTMAYLSDHEPALGATEFPQRPEWTSGYGLAADADLLLHDAQLAPDEYDPHAGWGHSTIDHAVAFATLARARHLVTFHHDPGHSDAELERITAASLAAMAPAFPVSIGAEGAEYQIGA